MARIRKIWRNETCMNSSKEVEKEKVCESGTCEEAKPAKMGAWEAIRLVLLIIGRRNI
jgi:hypothetical protein